MNWGSIFQLFVIMVLSFSTYAEFKGEEEYINSELHYLRVQKSYQQLANFEKEYGKEWKKVIKDKTEAFKKDKLANWNKMVYKSLFVVFLALVSIFYAIRYFYLNQNLDEDSDVVTLKYNTTGWAINFVYLLTCSGWLYYFSNNIDGSLIIYGLAVVNLMLAIIDLSKIFQLKKGVAKTAKTITTILCIILYYHFIAIAVIQYMPAILSVIELLKKVNTPVIS